MNGSGEWSCFFGARHVWRFGVGVVLWSCFLAWGCASSESVPWGDRPVEAVEVALPDGSAAGANIPPGWSGGVTAVGTVHPAVRHGSVELPAVSPDGKWIAYFDHAEGTARPTMDSLFSGRGLEGVSLWVRGLDGADSARPAALEGACWPAWAGDGSALFFVTYDAAGRCYLGRFDVATGRVERKAVGLRHMLQVAADRDGSRLAVVGYANVPDEARVYVVDWSASSAAPVGGGGEGPQVSPAWASGRDLLYVQLSVSTEGPVRGPAGRAELRRWGMDGPVATLPLRGTMMDAVLLQQGVPSPFDAGRGAWMVRDGSGVTRVIDLATGGEAALPVGTAAAHWWAEPWAVVGGPSELAMVEARVPEEAGERNEALAVRLRLLSGRWAPRHTDVERGSVVLVGMGQDPELLAVYQLWVVVNE